MCAIELLRLITVTVSSSVIIFANEEYAHVNSLIAFKVDHDETIVSGFIVSQSIKLLNPKAAESRGCNPLVDEGVGEGNAFFHINN